MCNVCAARINDGDAGFEDDDWQHQTQQSGQIPLRANRWWTDLGAEGGDPLPGHSLQYLGPSAAAA